MDMEWIRKDFEYLILSFLPLSCLTLHFSENREKLLRALPMRFIAARFYTFLSRLHLFFSACKPAHLL